jgi:CheY-like chemotaxis protein
MVVAVSPCDILVVEDDEAIRQVLALVLQEEGHTVATAENGQDALLYLNQAKALPRLILLDLMMPVMNGWQFRAAQQNDPSFRTIPVIVLSAINTHLDIQQRVELNAAAFVSKPIDWPYLEQHIANLCP